MVQASESTFSTTYRTEDSLLLAKYQLTIPSPEVENMPAADILSPTPSPTSEEIMSLAMPCLPRHQRAWLQVLFSLVSVMISLSKVTSSFASVPGK